MSRSTQVNYLHKISTREKVDISPISTILSLLKSSNRNNFKISYLWNRNTVWCDAANIKYCGLATTNSSSFFYKHNSSLRKKCYSKL